MIIRNKFAVSAIHGSVVLAFFVLAVILMVLIQLGYQMLAGSTPASSAAPSAELPTSYWFAFVITFGYCCFLVLATSIFCLIGVPNWINRIALKIIGYRRDRNQDGTPLSASITFVYRARPLEYLIPSAVSFDDTKWPFLTYQLSYRKWTVMTAPGDHQVSFCLGLHARIKNTIHVSPYRHYLVTCTPPKNLFALTLKRHTDNGNIEIKEL